MDDFPVIVTNQNIRSISNFLANTFPMRPLREITFLLDYSLFGLDPWGYHFQNIFWHALNCWLVYLVALRLDLGSRVAWLASLLFLVHPIHVEVVANSSHRKDSLALAFMLMALLAYTRIFERKATAWRVSWLAASVALWVTAFFAKGNSLVFPAIVIMYEYALVPEDSRMIVRWKRMVPILFASSVVGLPAWYLYISTLPSFQMVIMEAFIKVESLASFSLSAYVLMVLKSCAFMLSKLILPLNLSMEYIYSAPKSLYDPWVLSTLLLIPAVSLIAYRWQKTSPPLFFLLALVAILWLPTANLVWHFSYFAADRYMYAPSAGLCIMAALLSEQALAAARRYAVVVWICILCVSAVLTWKQTSVWHDEMSLNTQILKISPRSLEAMVGLSKAYFSIKDYDMAALYAQRAIERDYTDYRPYIALGSVYDEQGKSEQAIELFKTALKMRPDHFQVYTNIGIAYERLNNLSEAELALNKSLTLNNNYAPTWFNLGVVRYRKNDKQGARLAFSEALKRDSSHVDALTNLSIVCEEIGDDACYRDAARRLGSIAPDTADRLQKR